jgi:hypothetical protein
MSDESPQNKVPFPLAGGGATLRFRTMDMVVLREQFGEPKIVKVTTKNELGFDNEIEVFETFTDRLDQLVRLHDPLAIIACLRAGLKEEDGTKPFQRISLDDLPFGLKDAVRPIQDALVLGITGESYAVLLRKQAVTDAAAREKQAMRDRGIAFNDDEDPTPDPTKTLTEGTSSPAASGSGTEQA